MTEPIGIQVLENKFKEVWRNDQEIDQVERLIGVGPRRTVCACQFKHADEAKMATYMSHESTRAVES